MHIYKYLYHTAPPALISCSIRLKYLNCVYDHIFVYFHYENSLKVNTLLAQGSI